MALRGLAGLWGMVRVPPARGPARGCGGMRQQVVTAKGRRLLRRMQVRVRVRGMCQVSPAVSAAAMVGVPSMAVTTARRRIPPGEGDLAFSEAGGGVLAFGAVDFGDGGDALAEEPDHVVGVQGAVVDRGGDPVGVRRVLLPQPQDVVGVCGGV